MKVKKVLVSAFLLATCLMNVQAQRRNEIQVPDLDGYTTLKCDFHMHTVFSDGLVWPTVRVDEAYREGLDAISLTEHIEYRPHKKDIVADHNRSFDLCQKQAEKLGILLIRGSEITRPMAPGHFNAIFLADSNPLEQKEYKDAFNEAKKQGAFIFWNHPGWAAQQPDTTKWWPEHTELYNEGCMHGIEVANGPLYMPEAVQCFAEDGDFAEVRVIQKRILAAYEQDFSKHAPNETVPKIRMLWNSIPSQLAKENKKFLYSLVREGGRAKEYETAIMWLIDCGLVHKVSRVNAAGIPLKAYEDLKAFKLFIVDIGLLSCMVGLNSRTILDGNALFVEFKGALTEQYVCQQLKTVEDLGLYYYTNDRGSCEVDFIVDTSSQIIPVEVKAEINLRAKSLKIYCEKYKPEIAVRTSMADFKKEDWLINLPLYAIDYLPKL